MTRALAELSWRTPAPGPVKAAAAAPGLPVAELLELACRAPERCRPARAAAPLGFGWRCLLTLTSRTFSFERDLAPHHRHAFAPYAEAGWRLRAASPRYWLCWRRSGLLARGTRELVFLPDGRFALNPDAKAVFCLFELFRRASQVALVARGLPPELADAPAVTRGLQEAALRRLLGPGSASRAACAFGAIAAKVEDAVTGFPGGAP